MKVRFSGLATKILVVAITLLTAGRSWAVFNLLGPSKDEWGLKYEVQTSDAGGGMVTVAFTLADEGRLKPLALIELIALSKEIDSEGGHTYDVRAPIVLKPTHDGRRAGQVQMRKDLVDRARIRILSGQVDGQPQQSGWALLAEIPINKFLHNGAAEAPMPSRQGSKVEQ